MLRRACGPAFIRLGQMCLSAMHLLVWVAPLLIGCAAVLLAFCADAAFAAFQSLHNRWWWWPFLSLPLGGVGITYFMRRIGRGAEGSGIPQAKAALLLTHRPERLKGLVSIRLAVVKFLSIVAGMFSGFVLGLEGPTVQIGSSIFYSFRRFLAKDSMLARRQLITAGGAAGIAAAFNAPLAGVIFAFEELMPTTRGNTPIKLVIAVILAGMVAEPVFGYQSYFGRVALQSGMPVHLLPQLLGLAVCGGLVGGAFAWAAIRGMGKLPFPLFSLRHPYLFVALCGLLIALAGLAAPIYGSGAQFTKAILAGETSPAWQYFPLKLLGLLLTFFTGLPGGVFSPSLSIGAGLGFLFTPHVDALWQIQFTALGMVAVLAAVTRAPLTSAFIMIEMTSGQGMVLPAAAVALVASWTAGRFKVNFYRELAGRMLYKAGQGETREG